MDQTTMLASRKTSTQRRDIDLIVLFKLLLNHAMPIIITAVLCGVLSFLFTKFFITPMYETQFTAYVNNRSGGTEDVTSLSNSDLTASQSLVSTYSEIIVSNSVLQAAAEDVGLEMSYDELAELVETGTASDTEVICVKVKGYSPAMAQRFAQAVAEQAQVQITNIVDGTSMRLIDTPMLPTETCSPSYLKNVVIAAFVGFVVACLVIVIRDMVDDRVRSEKMVEDALGFVTIGTIPNCKQALKVGDNYGYGYGQKRHSSGGAGAGSSASRTASRVHTGVRK